LATEHASGHDRTKQATKPIADAAKLDREVMKVARCVALLSGGLDSILAIRVLQEQGVEVEALNFKTIFTCCQNQSAQAARELNVPLTVIGQEDDYLQLIRRPRFGYGRGANPCVDCRIYMFDRARLYMDEIGADFIASGEILGQRPMSQKRRDLEVIAYHSGLEDLLLRPLSAKMMPVTRPERLGLVDRSKLHSFWGRSRKGLIELAKQFGLRHIPHPSTGCALTEVRFSKKVFDLMKSYPKAGRWDFEILKMGRHFRFDDTTKVIVGRSEEENGRLEHLHSQPDASSTAALRPLNFRGPLAMILGPACQEALQFAGGLQCRYGNLDGIEKPEVEVLEADRTRRMEIHGTASSRVVRSLAIA
jgi:tRNA U34 2-thiouridine synthase MnmA/TrmU